jgi:hypothetical protein
LTPAAALAFFPRSAARKDVYEGAKYTMFLTLPIPMRWWIATASGKIRWKPSSG